MMSLTEIEDFLLKLPVSDRARVASTMWESIVTDPKAQADPSFDLEGLKIAHQCALEIENGSVEPVDHEEFLRLTRKNNED